MSSCCPQRGYTSAVNYLRLGGSQLFLERHGYYSLVRRNVWPKLQTRTLKVHREPQRQPYPPIPLQYLPDPQQTTGVTRAWPYDGQAGTEQ
jgi:hypothetical protein